MKYFNEIRENLAMEAPRWLLIALGVAIAVLLAMTIETGRAHAAGTAFTLRGALNRIITPNGDAKNDVSIHCVENPKDSSLIGTIYDLRGHFVADMARIRNTGASPLTIAQCKAAFPVSPAFPLMDAMVWDGRAAGGTAVTSGVYVYRVEGEDTAVTGTVVVAR